MLVDEERAIDEDDWLYLTADRRLRCPNLRCPSIQTLPTPHPGWLPLPRLTLSGEPGLTIWIEDPRVQQLRDVCDA